LASPSHRPATEPLAGILALVTGQLLKFTHHWLFYYYLTVAPPPLCRPVVDRSTPTLDFLASLASTPLHSFYPTSAAQLHDHLQIPSTLDHRIPGALTWSQFRHRHKSCMCPHWHLGQQPPLKTTMAMWPQHSTIASYFAQIPDGTACSFSCFMWLIHQLLNPPAVQARESILAMAKGSLFVDTLLCPPLCPLCRCTHDCGWDVALVSTSHARPSMYILVHWAWDFLSQGDCAQLCHIPTSVRMTDWALHDPPQCLAPALHAYT